MTQIGSQCGFYKNKIKFTPFTLNNTYYTQLNAACVVKEKTNDIFVAHNEQLSSDIIQLHLGLRLPRKWITLL